MTTVALEGTGAKIYIADLQVSADLIELSIDNRAREIIETTHLGTPVAKTFKPGKTQNYGRVTAQFDCDPEGVILTGLPPQEIVIEYPGLDGGPESTFSFYGVAVKQGKEEMRVDQRMTTSVEFVTLEGWEFFGYTVTNPPPTVTLSIVDVNGFDVTFDAVITAYGSYTVTLNFGDGTSVTNPTLPITHTYPAASHYTATITVTQADAQSANDTEFISTTISDAAISFGGTERLVLRYTTFIRADHRVIEGFTRISI